MGAVPTAVSSIPLLDLRAQYATIKDELETAVLRVMRSGHYIGGSEVEQLEAAVAEYCRCHFAVGCASGTDAILLALRGLGIGPGDEVIVPTFTFFATAGAVSNVGATPIFVDIDPDTFNLDPRGLTTARTPRTKAVIAVHLFGQCADLREIDDFCHQHELFLIEDAAQAIGAVYHSHRAGRIGHVGCLSFFPSKNLGAMGDGGMVVVREDEALADRIRLLRQHGAKPKYIHHLIGTNSRLDALQAAVLRVKLNHLDQWTAKRQANADAYDRLLDDLPLIRPIARRDRSHIYNQYVIRIRAELRDALRAWLKEHGIGTEVYYPRCLHQQDCYADLPSASRSLPVAEAAAREVLALPIYPELTAEQTLRVSETIRTFFTL